MAVQPHQHGRWAHRGNVVDAVFVVVIVLCLAALVWIALKGE